MRQHLPILVVLLPLLGAVLAAILRDRRAAWAIALAVGAAGLVSAVFLFAEVRTAGTISYPIGGWAPALGIEYRIDSVNSLVILLVAALAAVLMPYARRSVAAEIAPDRQAWFYAMLLLCLAGLQGIAATGDAFNAFVFLEISSLSSYTMIALSRDRRALVAAYQYLIMGTVGATFYVIGVGFLYLSVGTLNFGLMADRLADLGATRPVLAGTAFVTVGLALKVALFPLHAWLPNAYAYAPSAATAFLAGTATKVAIYLLLRYLFSVFGAAFGFGATLLAPLFLALSLAAAFGASAVALFQSNAKRMFAYSSVAQIGTITLAIGLSGATALAGGLVHLVGHGVMKAGLFMALGAVFLRLRSVDLDDMTGLGRTMPLTMAALTLAGLGLVGVPGTVGFVAKWYLVVAALERGWWWLAFLVVASSLVTLAYVARLAEIAWLRPAGPKAAAAREAPADMLAAAWLLVGASVWLGLDGNLVAGPAARAAAELLAGFR